MHTVLKVLEKCSEKIELAKQLISPVCDLHREGVAGDPHRRRKKTPNRQENTEVTVMREKLKD